MPVLPRALEIQGEISAIRRDIHAHPELAFEEDRTSDIVAAKLQEWGLEVTRGLGKTGVVGTLRKGNSVKSIGLRADMDCLPMDETNDFAAPLDRMPAACMPAAMTATPPCCWAPPRC